MGDQVPACTLIQTSGSGWLRVFCSGARLIGDREPENDARVHLTFWSRLSEIFADLEIVTTHTYALFFPRKL